MLWVSQSSHDSSHVDLAISKDKERKKEQKTFLACIRRTIPVQPAIHHNAKLFESTYNFETWTTRPRALTQTDTPILMISRMRDKPRTD